MLHRTIGFAIAIFLLGFVTNAHALQLTLEESFGSDPASGAIVLDITAAGDGSYVDIAMDTTQLSSPEYIKELYLNIKDASVLSGEIESDGRVRRFGIADAGFKAGGDGYHDVFIQWRPAANVRLDAGEIYEIRIFGTGLTADMFDDYGTASDKGQFQAVVKVNATGGGSGSDWVGSGGGGGGSSVVPEPSGVLLFSAGMLLVAMRMRRG